ncbi:MAG: peptidoglycan DD-metalloendopeptidase family protein [Gammaproteobacteria bacterium]|nr:peptidoglycan DD-metalloendopeptidase family protein [Gammaproteobacteria bacterium]
MMLHLCRFIAPVLLLVPLVSMAQGNTVLPGNHPFPGGLVSIKLDGSGDSRPKAFFGNKPLLVIKENNAWYAVVGIGLKTEPGEHRISAITTGDQKLDYAFTVTPKKYPAQYLKVKQKRYVEPDKNDIKRILKEKQEITETLSAFSELQPSTLKMKRPANGRLSSRFGLRRFFNGQERSPHTGLDIAAGNKAVIRAPLDGKVIRVANYFFSGNIVFIDHGQGLISTYAHLHRALVREGQNIKTGERVGEVGATGRVTGPHLHWSVYLNQEKIDPALLL